MNSSMNDVVAHSHQLQISKEGVLAAEINCEQSNEKYRFESVD